MCLRAAPRWLGAGLAAWACIWAAPAWALDLAQAYQAALANDATLRAARAAADSGRERVPQARAQLLPQISASAQRSRNDLSQTSPTFGGQLATNDYRYTSSNETLTVRQPLLRKELVANLRQARALVASSDATLERESQSLVARVTEAYFLLLLAEEQLRLIDREKATYRAQLDAAGKAFAAGAGTRTDIDEAQARLDLVTAQELEARLSQDYARRQLQSITGLPADSVAAVDVRKLVLQPPEPNRLDDWLARAEAQSPEMRQLRAQLEAAREEVRKAQAEHYPTLDAVAQWQRSSSENTTNINSRYRQAMVGVQLNVPIYQGGYVNSRVRQALAEVERAENSLEALRRDLNLRVQHEFHAVAQGVLKVRALEQAVRSNEQLALSSRKSYQAGARTQLDILNAEAQLAAAERDLAQARHLYLLSRARLKSLAGELESATIDEVNGWLQH